MTPRRLRDRFDIRGPLGEGGMGIVYEAVDRQRGERVAIKTIRDPAPNALFRFKKEFRALHDLRHPNLVSLGELHEEAGRWFFTMELVDGVDILAWVRRRADAASARTELAPDPRPIDDAAIDGPIAAPDFDEARLRSGLLQLARGVDALHRARRVHRDIKPSNVLVTPEARVVLLDFGLVSQLEGGAGLSDVELAGTAAYMAPEQWTPQRVGPAADWYSVGVLLYEALTGAVPFRGAPVHVGLAKMNGAPPPPPRTRVAGVPPDLDDLCCALLRLDPSARPTGDEVLARLERDRGAPPSVRPPRPTGLFVGRARELDALERARARCADGPSVVVVEGPSGVGKSALVQTFVARTLERMPSAVVLEGRCYEREAVPFKAFDGIIDALAAYMRRLRDVDAAALVPLRASMLADAFPVLRMVRAFAAAPRERAVVADPHERRTKMFGALRELLDRVACRTPLVLVIDDLQWADGDSLAALREVLRGPDGPPLLVVATRRATDAARLADASIGTPVERLSLDALPDDDARAIASALLADGPHARAAIEDQIVREAAGHPLFVAALARFAAARGELRADALRLDDVLWATAQRLSPTARSLLTVVSLAGAPIAQEIAADAAEIEPAALADAVRELRAEHLLRTAGNDLADALAPYHDRVRETVAARVDAEARRRAHERIARALERAGCAESDLLAVQWEAAGRASIAATHAARAAERAYAALAFDHAARLVETALRLGVAPEERRRLRVLLGDALTNAGRLAEAARVRLALADESDAATAVDLRRRAAEQLLCSGHYEEGLRALRAALAGVGTSYPATPLRALVMLIVVNLLLAVRGLRPRALAAPGAARELDRTKLLRVDCAESAGHGLLMTDNIRGVYYQAYALRCALDLGEPRRIVRALVMAALARGAPNRTRSRRLTDRAREIAAVVDTPEAHAMVASAEGGYAYMWADWIAATEPLRAAEALFRDRCVGYTFELNSVRMMLWRTLASRGRLRDLREIAPAALRDAEAHDDGYARLNVRAIAHVALATAADDVAQVTADLEAEWRRLPSTGFHVQHYLCLGGLAQVAMYAGDGEGAYARVQAQWPRLERSLLLSVAVLRILAYDLRARAAIAVAAGRRDPQRLLARADADARRLERERSSYARALGGALRAQVAAARGLDDAAVSGMRDAIARFDACDAALHAAAARRRLGEWIGRDEGARLVADGDAAMRAEGVRAPEAMTRLLLPGARR